MMFSDASRGLPKVLHPFRRKSTRHRPSSSTKGRAFCERRLRDSRRVVSPESLETRLALAVDVAFQSPAGGAEDWITIVANQGSDVFMQMVATPTRDLFVADNASFANRQFITGVDAAIDSIYVFNGQVVERSVNYAINTRYGLPEGYPFEFGTEGSLQFLLPSEGVDWSEQVSGVIDLNDASGNELIYFANGGYTDGTEDKVLRITKGPGVGGNLVVSQSSYGGASSPQLALTFDDNVLFGKNVGVLGVPTLNLTYDTDLEVRTATDPNLQIITASGIGSSVGPGIEIEVFDADTHQYVPGTLSGSLDIVLDSNPSTIGFQVDDPDPSLSSVPISFGGARSATGSFGTFSYYDSKGVKTAEEITVSAALNSKTGLMSLSFSVDGTAGRPFSPLTPEVSLALVDTDPANNAADPTGLLYDPAPNDFTLFPGHTFSRSLFVELPNEGSSVSIESPIVTAGGVNAISLAASDVNINAPVRASSAFRVPSGKNSAFGTITEMVTVNAALASPSFDIRMADDPATGAFQRSRFIVSQTGSISNLGDVLNRVPDTLPSADQIFVEVENGDIYIEGRVVAQDQSFFISSPQLTKDASSTVGDYPDFEPYQFTTVSRLTGVDVGTIDATTLAITLANDTIIFPTVPPTGPYYGSTAFSVLDISTNTSRLRVQASDRVNDDLEQPFPYVLTVREQNDLIIDAVAASSLPIDIEAAGSIDMLASLQSAGDVSLVSDEPLVLSAPLTTRFGAIDILAPSIDVRNSIRVLDTVQDERDIDVRLTTTAGELRLQDAVSAVNRVVLNQSGPTGVTGNSRIMADVVEVTADQDVSVRTRASRVVVRTPGATVVDEQDYGIFEIRDSSNVTLIANGYDQIITGDELGEENSTAAFTSPALYADIYDTSVLTVSAPNGSIDVLHYGTGVLSLGDIAKIDGNEATRMDAAGSVSIRSTLADITVFDAPAPVSAGRSVRVATTGILGGLYEANSPGVVASRLSNVRITRVNDDGETMAANGVVGVNAAYKYALELDGIDVTTLRNGDRILVKNGGGGVAGRANGVYTIIGIEYPVGDTSYVNIDLVRSSDSDTTTDLAEKHYVRVAEGTVNRGKVFTADGSTRNPDGTAVYNGWGNGLRFSNVFDNNVSTTPVVVSPIASSPGFVNARAITTLPLLTGSYAGSYDGGAGTITGTGPGFAIPAFDGVNVVVGDLVLVRYGAASTADSSKIDPQSAGLYVVASIGNGLDAQWQLVRYQGRDDDGDGNLDRFYTGRVAIDEGTLRTAVTGEMYEIGLRSLGFAPIRYQEASEFSYLDVSAGGQFDSVLNYRADIGSNDPSATVTYVVSTSGATNTATGSLGRMLTLYQMNSAVTERTGDQQDQRLQFSGSVSRINLRQELPAIYRPVSITANVPVTIDGTAITQTASGEAVRGGAVSLNIGPVRPNQLAASRRLVRPNSSVTDGQVYGLRFTDTSDGASVSGLAFGGFNNGAAVLVQGAENVLLENLLVGQDSSGLRLVNKVGVEIQGPAAHTTVRGSVIVNSTVAGVVLGANTGRVHLVGNSIGIAGQGNGVGVQVSTNGAVPAYVGAAATPATTVVNLTGRIESVNAGANTAVLRVTADELGQQARVGMVLYDSNHGLVRAITAVSAVVVDDVTYLDLTVGTANAVDDGGDGALGTGDEVSFQLGHQLESINDAGVVGTIGEVTKGDLKIKLPATVHEGDVFLGQAISSQGGTLLTGTVIDALSTGIGGTVITLSQPVAESGVALLLLGVPGANQILGNSDGIVVDGDSSRIVNAVVANSIFDGIRIERTDNLNGGVHQLGGALGTEPVTGFLGSSQFVTSDQNLSIYANGLAGLRLSKRVFAALGAFDNDPVSTAHDYGVIDNYLASSLQIRGNYIGFDSGARSDVGNGQTGTQNVVVDLAANDPGFADSDRISFLLLTDQSPRDDDGIEGNSPTDDRVSARLLANADSGLDSQMNQYGVVDGPPDPGPDGSTDRVVTSPRRPVVRG